MLMIAGESEAAVMMTFGDTQVFGPSPYEEAGFTISATTPNNAILDAADSPFSSPYFTFQGTTTSATIVFAGGPFDLVSLDIALGEFSMGGPTDITFLGSLVGGGSISTTFTNVSTIQNVVLNWTGLSSVTISGTDDPGLDNIVLVPEPSSGLVLGLGLFGAAVRRKRG